MTLEAMTLAHPIVATHQGILDEATDALIHRRFYTPYPEVPSTRQKKRMRWWVSLGFVGAAAILFAYGWYIFTMMSGGAG